MNAISVPQPEATVILAGEAPVKHLAWNTDHRGPLLIHVAKREQSRAAEATPLGWASNAVVGVVDLADCVHDEHPGEDPDEGGYYWVLINPRVFHIPLFKPGKVGLFQVADDIVAVALAQAKIPRARKKQAKVEK